MCQCWILEDSCGQLEFGMETMDEIPCIEIIDRIRIVAQRACGRFSSHDIYFGTNGGHCMSRASVGSMTLIWVYEPHLIYGEIRKNNPEVVKPCIDRLFSARQYRLNLFR
jgi:hypothetical protein